ncbi:MAG: gamma carbonic anhydrase family protein [Anaerotruncus sp.]|jgi:carbonic anhydrase/acetyltransferase-like protein (isoleucine patch superfamily)|nr:gamma carbonic anhydrase family protein [Anaerotruncus sp.]
MHNITLDPTAKILKGAIAVGTVSIGAESCLWYNAVVRGDIEPITIGAHTNIQDCCVLHTDHGHPLVVGDFVTVGHNAILHGCEIGDQTLIGMGAIVLSGAKIGKNCLIGAGTLVTGGMVIPDNSVALGSPAKIKRSITEQELIKNRRSAEHYQALMQDPCVIEA